MLKLSLKTGLILISILVAFAANAQNGKLKWENTTHDFGTIKEESGQVTCRFMFTNVGTDPIKLVRVKPGCGCTSSQHTKTAVLPGEKGFVEATYHTTNRPGPFRKSISVVSDDADSPNTTLFIKGKVIKKAKTIAESYPIAMGNMKLMKKHVHMGDVKSTESKVDTIKIFNNGKENMTMSFEQIPEYLEVKAIPENLEPMKEGILIIKFDGSKANDYGMISYHIGIRTNDNKQVMKTIGVSANVKQDFSGLTKKDMKRAPKVVFEQTTYDFGEKSTGEKVTYSFKFTNEGKKDLKILKVKSSCGCTATAPSQTVIKRRKTGSIDIVFDTSGRRGKQHKSVTVITNDPSQPVVTLQIQGELVK